MSNSIPILPIIGPNETKTLDSLGLRQNFLLGDIYQPGEIRMVYTHYERLIVGVASPSGNTLDLETADNLKMENFLDRREIGIINVAGDGKVTADEQEYTLSRLD